MSKISRSLLSLGAAGNFHGYSALRCLRLSLWPLASRKEPYTWTFPTRFYAALLDHRLVSAPVLEAMITRKLCGVYDERLKAVVDRGLGFLLSSSYVGHSYGPHASRRAFGHGGRNWSVAFADPAFGLAVAVYWNGRADGATQAERQPALLAALYRDLDLA